MIMILRTAYVAFPNLAAPPLTVAGKLRLPLEDDRPTDKSMAAVLICHGSDGVDGRGEFYAPSLNEAIRNEGQISGSFTQEAVDRLFARWQELEAKQKN